MGKRETIKIITALLLGFGFAALWTLYADIAYNNTVPLEAYAFHGLYPLFLGFSAVVVAYAFDKNFKALSLRIPSLKFFIIPLLLAACFIFIPFLINIAFGLTALNRHPDMDALLVYAGIPVIIILALGEEVMWRGLLFNYFIRRFSFIKTSFMIGLLWAFWHYPIIIHTKFVYADRPIWFSVTMLSLMTVALSFTYNYLRLISGSVWPCIILHTFENYFAFAILEKTEVSVNSASKYFVHDIGILYIIMVVLSGCIATWLYQKKLRPAASK